MQSIAFWAAVTAYALAAAALLAGAAFRGGRLASVGRWLAAFALAPHAAAIVLRWLEVGHGPYNTRYEVISADVFLLARFARAGTSGPAGHTAAEPVPQVA